MTAAPPPRAAITLADSIARGEATFLRVQGLPPVRLTWNNGLLATSQWLLATEGGDAEPRPGDNIQIELRHLTAVVRSGLCRLSQSGTFPRQLSVEVSCANSILAGSPGGPLVEQTGVEAGPAFRERLAWSGDRNFYEGFAVFWGVRRNDPEAPYEAMLFDGWKSYWGSQRENLPATNVIRWKQPPAEKPFHAHSADDYALARPVGDVSLNPAVGAASDNGDAGFQLDRLPQSASAPQTPAEPLGPKRPPP